MAQGAVLEQIRGFAQRPEMLSEVLERLERDRQEQGSSDSMADPGEVTEALLKFDPLWEQLSSWEQERFVRALVKQVRYDGVTQTVTVGFLSESIKELCQPIDASRGADVE